MSERDSGTALRVAQWVCGLLAATAILAIGVLAVTTARQIQPVYLPLAILAGISSVGWLLLMLQRRS